MKHGIDYSLYLCTDRRLMTSPTIEASAESALRGGTTVIQLREKDCSSREFYELGLRVKKITDAYHAPLIINDRVDIALAVGAAGVHVGQGDLPCKVVREIVGPDMIVGVSAATLEEAVRAEQDGADYLGVGAMYATATKTDTRPVSMEELLKIRAAVKIPIVVIGGINKQTLGNFKGTGVNGLAVVSAIVAQPDPEAAARELLRMWKE
ncbi:MAG TPA: thiamine phosphate synthase [Candidatus Faecivivens stercoravium]|uniref:Thiamine-phosphate synthase n=1 Tax=Candidatus Faecivivens stercoravium TaxID=2840803 RepID=A0A9D1J5F1_9FIRM|nr:thiamine phosphate synthase [Candidatus Faecivivens stercoravium]